MITTTSPRPCPRAGRYAGPAIAFAMTCALSACATVGPDFKQPEVHSPAQWREQHGGQSTLPTIQSAQAAVLADRWALFNDAELTRLQALATQSNHDIRGATLRLMQSRVHETTVSAQRGVQVNAKTAASRQRQSESGAGTRLVGAIGGANQQQLIDVLSAPFPLYQAGFDASWEPDLWGRVTRTEEAAAANTFAQQAALRQVQLSVRAEVARAYFLLRSAQAQLALVQDELRLAKEALTLLQAHYQGGLSDASAVIRQRAQVAMLESLQPALQAQETHSTNQITLLCGETPGRLNQALSRSHASAKPPSYPDLRLGLPSELLRQRPDIAAAEARLHATVASIGIAMADLYPRISLGASFGLESVSSAKFGDWGSHQWRVGPSLSIALFDQGRRRSIVTLRELQQQEAAVAYQQTVLNAWHEVDDSLSAYAFESQRGEQLARQLELAEEEAGLARARHTRGMVNYLAVLNSEARLLQAKRVLADNTARLSTALAALYKALADDR